jgi:phenylacetaldehyde dehydrogenase
MTAFPDVKVSSFMSIDLAQSAEWAGNALAKPGTLFIGGEWVPSASAATLTTFDPGSGTRLTEVPLGDAADIDAAVSAARAALAGWRATAPMERASILWRLADLIEANADDLALLETLDTGKPLSHSRNYDLPSAVNQFRYQSGLANRINGQVHPMATMPGGVFHSYTRLEPIGVIGAITPWNFPLANVAWKLAPALACGNTVVVKPSEETPLTTLRLGELLTEAGLPSGVVNIVTGDGSTGRALVAHPGIDKITFTGSTATGQKIVRDAADNMTRVSAELGGKNPNIIFADADLEAAIAGGIAAGYWDSGQVCSSSERFYVEASVVDQFIEGFSAAVKALPIGHGLEPDVQIGSLISQKHRSRVAAYIDAARSEGVEVAFGGSAIEGDGAFFEPTLLLGASADAAVMTEEVFGPVVSVVPFSGTDEVIAAANDTTYGLAAAVWTRDISKAHQVSEAVEAGVVWVNTYGVVDPAFPWGGFKRSGWGRENAEQVLHEFTEQKAVAMQFGTF